MDKTLTGTDPWLGRRYAWQSCGVALLAGREFLIQQGDLATAKIQRLEAEVAMLREELRINAARMAFGLGARSSIIGPLQRVVDLP